MKKFKSAAQVFQYLRGVHSPLVSRQLGRVIWMAVEDGSGGTYIKMARVHSTKGEFYAEVSNELEAPAFYGCPEIIYKHAPLPQSTAARRWRMADHWYRERMRKIDEFAYDAYVESQTDGYFVIGEASKRNYLLHNRKNDVIYSVPKTRVRRWVVGMAAREMFYG